MFFLQLWHPDLSSPSFLSGHSKCLYYITERAKSAHSDHFYVTHFKVLLSSVFSWFLYLPSAPKHLITLHQSPCTIPAAQLKPTSIVCHQKVRQIPNEDHALPLSTSLAPIPLLLCRCLLQLLLPHLNLDPLQCQRSSKTRQCWVYLKYSYTGKPLYNMVAWKLLMQKVLYPR